MLDFNGTRVRNGKACRFLTFGYNRRQLPIEIGCPGGTIIIEREKHGTIAVTLNPDGSRMVDHTGEVETPAGGRQRVAYVVRLVHEGREAE